MKVFQFSRSTGTGAVFAVLVIGGMLSSSPPVLADDNQDDSEASVIKRGFEIAPVPLNLAGKNQSLVGLGSYIVNGSGDCNGCHTGGGPPNFNFAAGRNPYFGQPTKTDPTTYLEGGTDFGPAVPPVPGVYPPPAYWLAS